MTQFRHLYFIRFLVVLDIRKLPFVASLLHFCLMMPMKNNRCDEILVWDCMTAEGNGNKLTDESENQIKSNLFATQTRISMNVTQ